MSVPPVGDTQSLCSKCGNWYPESCFPGGGAFCTTCVARLANGASVSGAASASTHTSRAKPKRRRPSPFDPLVVYRRRVEAWKEASRRVQRLARDLLVRVDDLPRPVAAPRDPAIAALSLSPAAEAAALRLKAKFPRIAFVSGSRTVEGQASAMAQNIVRNTGSTTVTTKSELGAKLAFLPKGTAREREKLAARAREIASRHGLVFPRSGEPWVETAPGGDAARTFDERLAAFLKDLDRQWIKTVYAESTTRELLQRWVDDHPEAVTQKALADGLLGVLESLPEAEVLKFAHVRGREGKARAFDLVPGGEDARQLGAAIESLPGMTWWTDKEGNLDRWHVQF